MRATSRLPIIRSCRFDDLYEHADTLWQLVPQHDWSRVEKDYNVASTQEDDHDEATSKWVVGTLSTQGQPNWLAENSLQAGLSPTDPSVRSI